MNRRLFFSALVPALWLTYSTHCAADEKIAQIGFLTYCVSSLRADEVIR